jgi:ABC-type bacteriocin/lantibiotic exporter with double-glycine peptidase domain
MKFLIIFCGKKSLLILFFASFILLLLDLVGIAMIFPFLNLFVSPEIVLNNQYVGSVYKAVGFRSVNEFICVVGGVLIVAYALRLILKTIINSAKFHVGGTLTYRLSNYLYKGILHSNYDLFTDNSTSEIIGIINSQTTCSVICLEAVVKLINELFFLTVILIISLYINPTITLVVALIFLVLGVLLYFGLVKKIESFGKKHTNLNLLVYKHGYTMASSIKDIKIMRLENEYIKKFSEIWHEYALNDARSKTVKGVPMDLAETIVFCGIISVCLYLLISDHNVTAMIPVLGVVAVTAMRVLPSFNRMIAGCNEYKYYKRSLSLVRNLIDKINLNQQKIEHLELPFKEKLAIKGLKFCYEDKIVLDSISLQIERGGSFGFVGASGAGKSTLLDILVGLRQAETGKFYMDDTRFDPFKTDALKNWVGYVPQSVNLIDESIAFNIAFEKNYDMEKMNRVISITRLDEFVAGSSDGLDTIIGESGVRVSGGQKQRIGIARALYKEPEILIFDEATSSLDTVTERDLMREINQLSGEKTLIIVAHRLSTVEQCDAIHLLDNGNIIAKGTHDELLKSSPQYRTLYTQQEQLL